MARRCAPWPPERDPTRRPHGPKAGPSAPAPPAFTAPITAATTASTTAPLPAFVSRIADSPTVRARCGLLPGLSLQVTCCRLSARARRCVRHPPDYPPATSLGRMSAICPRSTASARSSIAVGSPLTITTRAPARRASGTTSAAGYTVRVVPTASSRSHVARRRDRPARGPRRRGSGRSRWWPT